MIQPQIDMLLQYFGREVDELVRAKEEYFSQTGGEVHADDRCYEQRMQAFFNWFLFDRRQVDGATPIERFLREKGGELSGKDKDVILGFTNSRLGLYEYRGTRGFFSRPKQGQVRVRDAVTGDSFNVTERRQMHGLDIGDLFESRLIPLDKTYHFSTSFTYHPPEVYPAIRSEIKRRKKKGTMDVRRFVFELERMALQHERFRNVSIQAIYNFQTPFLSKKTRTPEAQQGG